MKTKLSDPLYTRDLARILKISTDAARRKIKSVKEITGYEIISIGNYIEHSKTSPLIFGFENQSENV